MYITLRSKILKIKNLRVVADIATNTILNAKISEVEYETPNITNLATNASLNGKINKAKNKIVSITNLATTNTAPTAVENKISDHSKYIFTPEVNKLTVENFNAILKQANLATKDNNNNKKKTDCDGKQTKKKIK